MGTITFEVFSKKPWFFMSHSIFTLLTFFSSVIFGLTYTKEVSAQNLKSDEFVQARDYVLAACIVDRYKGEPIASEADAWAAGLVENGSFPAATYVALSKLAKSAPQPSIAQQGIVMKLQNCVDFANSKKLAAQLGKTLRH